VRQSRLVGLLLVLLTLLVYLPVWQHGFVAFDDQDYVVHNRMVKAGLTGPGVAWAFTTFHASNWHPLTWLSHMLDSELFGPHAGAHHLTSVLLHAVNSLLLYLLWLRLTGRLWPAAFVAALFAWHPLHVESVAWVAERKDVLSTCFGLLALLAYVDRVNHPRRKAALWYSLALLCFALSLLAKPMLVTLPFLLLLLDYWPLGRFGHRTGAEHGSKQSPHLPVDARKRPALGRLIIEKWPFFLVAAGACVMTLLAQRAEAIVSMQEFPLGHRVGNAVIAYGSYLAKCIWPVNLAVLYPAKLHLNWVSLGCAVVVLGAISALAIRTVRRQPYLLMGWLWFLGTLVPVIGLVQVGSQAMADRYTYVPLIGIFVLIAFGADELAARWTVVRRGLASMGILVLLACLGITSRQLQYWQDSEQLFRRAVAVTIDNAPALAGLGDALARQGKHDEALEHFREALRLAPASLNAHNDLANLLAQLEQLAEAEAHYRAALQLNPNLPLIHCNLGLLLVRQGRIEEALTLYATAAQLDARDPRPHQFAGHAHRRQGKIPEAIASYHAALTRDSEDVGSLIALAQVLASDPDQQLRNGVEAVRLAEKALPLSGSQQIVALDALAMAYAEVARFREAQEAVQAAIDLATPILPADKVGEMRSRQQLYQSGQPYRAPRP